MLVFAFPARRRISVSAIQAQHSCLIRRRTKSNRNESVGLNGPTAPLTRDSTRTPRGVGHLHCISTVPPLFAGATDFGVPELAPPVTSACFATGPTKHTPDDAGSGSAGRPVLCRPLLETRLVFPSSGSSAKCANPFDERFDRGSDPRPRVD